MGDKVVVGMSGGVDSSVAALLLKEQGYEVIGVTMRIWQEEDSCTVEAQGGCCGLDAVEDARRVCEMLGIPYYVMDFREDFQLHVKDYFAKTYACGQTPNPCIACNRFVKWEGLLRKSRALGAKYLATGHYARINRLKNGRYTVSNAATARKDQTYALYSLTQDQLAHTLFPVGDYEKEEIREMARRHHLPVAAKPDSQDICFVPDGDYASVVEEMLQKKFEPGNFVNRDGKVLGQHKGYIHYTIGQRKGLGLALGVPGFVTQIRPETNEVVIGTEDEVRRQALLACDINYMAIDSLKEPRRALVKIRYNHPGAEATIDLDESGRLRAVFDEPQKGIAPGQAVVCYEGDHILLGGTIQNSFSFSDP